MEPITSWSKEKVRDWLKGLEAPLQQYPFKEWQVTGLELLQLSAQDLERLGVHKIGHQELIFEAVEKLCTLTYGMGGENLRCLTEKLRLVAQSMTMGIQIRWRVNTYDGRSATKLPASILEVVLELITSAKGLFSLLNRYQFAKLSGVTASKNIITYCKDLGATCRQLVAVCDEILTCCPEDLLAHTAQLESVDLVPVSPGDQLGVQITSTGSSNHYVTGTIAESPAEFCEKILAGDEVIQVNDQIVVGWSRRNLVKKLEENPTGVSLVLKRLPVTPNRKDTTPRSFRQKREEEQEEEVTRAHTHTHTHRKTTAMSRRRVSCRELGRPECDGWLWKKRKESSVFMTQKWQRFWFVLKGPSLYWYTSQQEEKAEGLIHISSYNIESAGEHKRKFVFQMCHQRFQTFFFAAENVSDMSKWINCLITAIQKHKKNNKGQPDSEEECYSETESEEEASYSPSPRRTKIYTVRKDSSTRTLIVCLENMAKYFSPPLPGAPEDEMGVLFHRLKEGGVSLIGSSQPVTHDHFRRSFIRRNKNPVINEKVHTLRALHSTLKDREAELQLINKVLEDPELTPQKYRLWKDHNQDLHLEIQKLAVQRAAAVTKETTRGVSEKGQGSPTGLSPGETVAVETEGAYGLSLSDGEMLVDAESSMFSSEEKNAMSDSDVEPAEIHPKDARASSLENYFYI
uniref:Connector enhancer of kinase suppressor of Ras 1 n=1 Tax=Esox lucius TaxID=8010 RepID=A0A3P8YFM3_ESOLU